MLKFQWRTGKSRRGHKYPGHLNPTPLGFIKASDFLTENLFLEIGLVLKTAELVSFLFYSIFHKTLTSVERDVTVIN